MKRTWFLAGVMFLVGCAILTPEDRLAWERGKKLQEEGQHEKAIVELTRVMNKFDTMTYREITPIRLDVARSLYALKRLTEAEEILGPTAALHHLFLGRPHVVMHEQAALGPAVVQPVEDVLDLAAGDAQAQMSAGHRLHVVGLVEDHHFVLGQNAPAFASECQVGEQQGVIDDENLGVAYPATCPIVETLLVPGAFPAHAVAVVAGHFVPDLRHGPEIEIGE